jgi:hypothetical protein
MQYMSHINCYKSGPESDEYEGKLKKEGGSQASDGAGETAPSIEGTVLDVNWPGAPS